MVRVHTQYVDEQRQKERNWLDYDCMYIYATLAIFRRKLHLLMVSANKIKLK